MTAAKSTVDLARLQALLDTYGPDPASFPQAERAAALALLAHDPAARALLADAVALAGALDALPSPLPSPALQRAVAEIPLRNPQLGAFALFAAWRSPSRALLSALMIVLLGVLSGAWSAGDDTGPDAAPFAAEAEEWHDLSALTFATDLDKELEP